MAEKESYGTGILKSSEALTIPGFFSFFQKKRIPGEFQGKTYPYEYVANPTVAEVKSLTEIFYTFEQFGNSEKDAGEVKCAFLTILNSTEMQRLNRLSQLGLIKPASEIRIETVVAQIEGSWNNAHTTNVTAVREINQGYLGGKRLEHVLKVAEITALKCRQMFVDDAFNENHNSEIRDYVYHYIFGAALHDLGHPVMSHKGEMAIQLALTLAENSIVGSPSLKKYAKLDHEQRALEIINTPKIKNILQRVGLSVTKVGYFITEDLGSLQDADPAAYLFNDFQNFEGDVTGMRMDDKDIDQLIRTSIWDKARGIESYSDRGAEIRRILLAKRLRAYRNIYRHPDMARMETQIGLGLALIIKDGALTLEDLLTGDDETILLKAKKIAESDAQNRYRCFIDGLEGVLFPHTITVNSGALSRPLQSALKKGPFVFQEKIIQLLRDQENIVDAIDPAMWYIVPPYPYSQKTLKYGDHEISLNIDPEDHETNVVLCFSENTPDEIIEKITRILEKGGVESEAKYLLVEPDVKHLDFLSNMNRMGDLIVTQSQLHQIDNYIFCKNIGTDEETYIRLRKVFDAKDRNTKYKITYKYPIEYKATKSAKSSIIDRGEIEIEIFPDEFEQFTKNPNTILESSSKSLNELKKRIINNHPNINLKSIGQVVNTRTRFNLTNHDGHYCEVDIDEIRYRNSDDTILPGTIDEFVDEVELEIEQHDLPQSEFNEVVSIFDRLAQRHPEVIKKNRLSKIARLLKKL